MESPYEEQYSQEGNPRAYMTMRDYRNLPWQWQQPIERNPNPYMSMREYRDQWMSAPVYNVPSTYILPVSPHFTSTSQQQQPPPLSPVEQAILNLSKQVDNFIEDNRVVNVQANREIETVKSSLNKELDGFQSEIDQKLDILQESISKLTNQFVQKGEESPEDEWNGTILSEQVQLKPQEELKMESVEAPEELQDAPESSVNFWPWTKEEQISALMTEEGSGIEAGKEPQKLTLQPIPLKLNPTATAQDTKYPLPVAPSADQVYILPSPAPQPTPAANSKPAAPEAKSNPLSAMQKFKKLVAIAQIFATTSKKMAAAHIAWHSGWFGCRFGFGAPEPRHFRAPLVPAASKGLRKWFGGTQSPPLLVLIFLVLFYFIAFYLDFYNFSL